MSGRLPPLFLGLGLLLVLTQCTFHEPTVRDVEGPPTMAASVNQARQVSYCDLIRNPAHYDKAILRTNALLHRNQENEFFDDPQCEFAESGSVWVTFDSSYIYSDETLRRRLIEMIRPKPSAPTGTARVTVVGRFEAQGGPYGHLDGYSFKFEIMRVEQVEESGPLINAYRFTKE